MNKRHLVFGSFLLYCFSICAQQIQEHIALHWQNMKIEKISSDIEQKYLYFDNAKVDYFPPALMPLFYFSTPIASKYEQYSIQIKNAQWKTLSQDEIATLNLNAIADTLQLKYHTEETLKQAFFKLSFLPFRKNGNQIEQLLSFDMQADVISSTVPNIRKKNTYAEHSILKSGNFYKMGISNTTIYKITPNDFKLLGINTSVPINQIAIFGNGGGELPQSTSEKVFDDLQELAIYVSDDNNNGIFDNNDYILFYGVGVSTWTHDYKTPVCQYSHKQNSYSNTTFYFLNIDNGIGEKKRITTLPSLEANPTHEVNTYHYFDVYEKDAINIFDIGTRWFADDFKSTTTRSYSFNIKGIDISSNIYLDMCVASVANAGASMTTTINNSKSFNTTFYGGNNLVNATYKDYKPTDENISLSITYNKSDASAVGYLDYIEIHAMCSLGQHNAIVPFRNADIVGAGNIAKYNFDTQGKNTIIWDVSDRHNIKQIQGSKNGNWLLFTLSADTLREMIAFDGSAFGSITPVGKINNQDLHGLPAVDFIIISHPNFLSAARQLAQYRQTNDNMSVAVVSTDEIYNEFSSGATDLSAIRNFLKMFYDRASSADNVPQNALLIGKTSYDVRQIEGTAPCFIPNYQGNYIFDADNNTSNDNYIGKLADGKGIGNMGTMDIGIGRWPVTTESQASALVQKSINYATKDYLSQNNVANHGTWQNYFALVADDDEDYPHMDNPEQIYKTVLAQEPMYNIEKIYSDAYKKESSSQGKRYPEVTKNINYRINNGCLAMTYFGHGGNTGWAHERILKASDINSWTNKYAQAVFYTACCSFAYYDQSFTSPGEKILLHTNGGGIGLVASTRNSSSGNNERLGINLFANMVQKNSNGYLTMGEVYRNAQNNVGVYESYTYLGDPSVTLAHPTQHVCTDSINHADFKTFTDTIKSLSFVTVCGHIADGNNNIINDFKGYVYPIIFDKIQSIATINNNNRDSVRHFDSQKSIIYKGKIPVKDGKFSFSFMVPKDINYEYGLGKISYYAYSDQYDANGYEHFYIGGMNDTIIHDEKGPDIELYLNDKQFVSGGISNPTPTILAKISDETGLNTAGAGIGHDILAIIDNDIANAVVLNDYFEFEENSYTSGNLSYLLSELPEGHHTLKVRAWDIVNNMGETEIEFEVVNNSELSIDHVLNYPNPFTTNTSFYFEHNKPYQPIEVKINIFTISGKLVKTIFDTQTTTGFRSNPIPWNGLDDYGNKIGKGVYLYKLSVRDNNNNIAEKIEKIVIL